MKVTAIKVHAGRTFNHPYESYSNLRPELTLEATLGPEEDFVEATRILQARAEGLVEDHKQHMLRSLRQLYEDENARREAVSLEERISRDQARLEELRQERPQLDSIFDVQRCRVCGCTDLNCERCIEKTGEPCHWVEPDLCSACAGEVS